MTGGGGGGGGGRESARNHVYDTRRNGEHLTSSVF